MINKTTKELDMQWIDQMLSPEILPKVPIFWTYRVEPARYYPKPKKYIVEGQ